VRERFYWDEVHQQFYADGPVDHEITTSQDDVNGADTYTTWTENGAGASYSMLSRRAFTELQQKGFADVRFRDGNGTNTNPIRLWLLERHEVTVLINNQPEHVRALLIGGDYAQNNAAKPKRDANGGWTTIPDIADPTDPHANINFFTVLDDPQYPIILVGAIKVQSVIPGRITDNDGHGVADAVVTVQGPDVNATSWPDGSFTLPVFDQPFAEFTVTVQAAGYEPLTITRDFRNADAIPLDLKLQPLPPDPSRPPAIWVDRNNVDRIDDVLSGLTFSPHSKRLISEAIRSGDHIGVLVPTQRVNGPAGPEVWLQVDTLTGATYGVLADGLYGSTAQKLGGATISYFGGRIAAWYLYGAGALDSVSQAISGESSAPADMHRNAIAVARELAKMYDDFGDLIDAAGGSGDAFARGLADGLDWANEFYGKAFG